VLFCKVFTFVTFKSVWRCFAHGTILVVTFWS
jgi:hypothetical protein